MPWNDGLIMLAKQMWLEGNSAAIIAEKLGHKITRSSVLGKLHRAGLKRDKILTLVAKPHARTLAKVKREPPTEELPIWGLASVEELEDDTVETETNMNRSARGKILIRRETQELVDAELSPVLKLTNASCRWPIGDPSTPAFRFCCEPGADFMARKPYCAQHTAVSRFGLNGSAKC